jgi:simple sugar transport system ATP-binding protein
VIAGGRAVDDRRPLYSAEGITKHFNNVVALERVNFSVDAGEVVGLVGDNGAGKSTLVGILSGAYAPDAGRIFLNNRETRWSSPHDALGAGIETVYQDSGIAPDLTIAANIFLGREILKKGLLGRLGFLAEDDMYRRARKELERVGIAMPGPNRTVSQLSGGQRQAAVAIGRAIAWAKKVILLDEPTNHLGARQAADVLGVIRQAGQSGLAVVFISHTLPHVLDVTDRIVVLRLGRVVEDRQTSQFTHESLLKAIAGLN